MLSGARRNHAIIPGAQQAFPSSDGQGQDAFQFVMLCSVRHVHHPRKQAETAGVVSGGAHAALYKGARNGVHFSKPGIGQTFLCGQRVRRERSGQGGETERITSVKKAVRARQLLELDECGWRRGRQGIGFCGCRWRA